MTTISQFLPRSVEQREIAGLANNKELSIMKIYKGKEKRGSVLPFVAIGLLVILGVFALVIDVGMLYADRSSLVNAADAGALAGASALGTDASPWSKSKTRAAAYVHLTEPDAAVSSEISSHTYTATDGTSVTIPNGKIKVTATRNKVLMFAKLLGFDAQAVGATASAGLSHYTGGTGIVPFGITEEVLNNMQKGERYIVKYGPQPPEDSEITDLGYPLSNTFKGNFGSLALGGSGASVYGDNIRYGTPPGFSVKIGDIVSTEPGVMSGPTDKAVEYRVNLDPTATYDNVAENSPRIIIVPIINPGVGDISGRTDVTIVGFSAFFLEDFQPAKGNGGYAIGRFIEGPLTVSGYGGGSVDTGLYVATLVE